MENEVSSEPTTAVQPELGIADLQNLRSIVEVSVRRGAFVAAELSSVGAVFDRLNAFLNAVAPAAAASSAPQDAS